MRLNWKETVENKLSRDFYATAPNQKWATDTNTSLQLHEQSVRSIDGMMDEIIKRYKKPDIEKSYVASQNKKVTEQMKLREQNSQDKNAKKHRH